MCFSIIFLNIKRKLYFLKRCFVVEMPCSRPLHQRDEKCWLIKEWTFERWVYQCITFNRARSGPGPGPGSPLKSDAWNWTITSAGGCWLGTCSPVLQLSSSDTEDKTNIFWWGRENCGTLACGIPQKVWRKMQNEHTTNDIEMKEMYCHSSSCR